MEEKKPLTGRIFQRLLTRSSTGAVKNRLKEEVSDLFKLPRIGKKHFFRGRRNIFRFALALFV